MTNEECLALHNKACNSYITLAAFFEKYKNSFTQEQWKILIENDKFAAIPYGAPYFDTATLAWVVDKYPKLCLKYLVGRLSTEQIDHCIRVSSVFGVLARFFFLLTAKQKAYLIKRAPSEVFDIRIFTLVSEEQRQFAMQKAPGRFLEFLHICLRPHNSTIKLQQMINTIKLQQIIKVVQQRPKFTLRYLARHNIISQDVLDKCVRKVPKTVFLYPYNFKYLSRATQWYCIRKYPELALTKCWLTQLTPEMITYCLNKVHQGKGMGITNNQMRRVLSELRKRIK